jgi:putative transposase
MKKSRFTEEQIAFALRQAEHGTSIEEITRKLGVSQQTFYRWRRKFAGMGVAEVRRPARSACAARTRPYAAQDGKR